MTTMNVIYHKKVPQSDLPKDSVAETFIFCIEITDINSNAKTLLADISNTSWISRLEPIAQKTFTKTSLRTIEKLVNIFNTTDGKVTKDFGEFMISMNSGYCLREKHNHKILPLSELWKPKKSGNEGFDFHTVSPFEKFSFGEAKFVSNGNAYGPAAEQICGFLEDGKDGGDIGLLNYFNKPAAVNNLLNDKKGLVVAFSINSTDYKKILKNALQNRDIKKLSKSCDELYIIAVKT